MIRFLTIDDFQECMEMSHLKTRVGGTIPTNLENWDSHYIQFFDGTKDRYAMGYFEDGVLQTFVCIILHENKARGKFWLIWSFFSKKFNNFFSFNDPDKGLLIKEAFKFAESKGYYEYYYKVSKRISKVYERQWLRNNFMETGRYDLIDLDVVPANTIPKVDLYQKMLFNTTQPVDIYFKKRVLKEKYRNK